MDWNSQLISSIEVAVHASLEAAVKRSLQPAIEGMRAYTDCSRQRLLREITEVRQALTPAAATVNVFVKPTTSTAPPADDISSRPLIRDPAFEESAARRFRRRIEIAEDRARRDPMWAETMARRHAAFRYACAARDGNLAAGTLTPRSTNCLGQAAASVDGDLVALTPTRSPSSPSTDSTTAEVSETVDSLHTTPVTVAYSSVTGSASHAAIQLVREDALQSEKSTDMISMGESSSCSQYGTQVDEKSLRYSVHCDSEAIQWEIAWTLRCEYDLLVQTDRLQNCILELGEPWYNLSELNCCCELWMSWQLQFLISGSRIASSIYALLICLKAQDELGMRTELSMQTYIFASKCCSVVQHNMSASSCLQIIQYPWFLTSCSQPGTPLIFGTDSFLFQLSIEGYMEIHLGLLLYTWSLDLMKYLSAILIYLSRGVKRKPICYFSQLQDLLIASRYLQPWPNWEAYFSGTELQCYTQFGSTREANQKKYRAEDYTESVRISSFQFGTIGNVTSYEFLILSWDPGQQVIDGHKCSTGFDFPANVIEGLLEMKPCLFGLFALAYLAGGNMFRTPFPGTMLSVCFHWKISWPCESLEVVHYLSRNQLHVECTGMCFGLACTTIYPNYLLPWDPGKKTGVSTDNVLSRAIAWNACVKQLGAEFSRNHYHHQKSGYATTGTYCHGSIQVFFSSQNVLGKCYCKGIYLELLPNQFDCADPFSKQYLACLPACASAYPAIHAALVPCEDFLLGSFDAFPKYFHTTYPALSAYVSRAASSVSYRSAPVISGLIFPCGSVSIPWEKAWFSLFDTLKAIQNTCERWSYILWAPSALLLLGDYENSTLKGPVEQWDPGIATGFHFCTQLYTMNYVLLHGHAYLHSGIAMLFSVGCPAGGDIFTYSTYDQSDVPSLLSSTVSNVQAVLQYAFFLRLHSMYLEPWLATLLPYFFEYLIPRGLQLRPWKVVWSEYVQIPWQEYLGGSASFFWELPGACKPSSMWLLNHPGDITKCGSQLFQWIIAWPSYPAPCQPCCSYCNAGKGAPHNSEPSQANIGHQEIGSFQLLIVKFSYSVTSYGCIAWLFTWVHSSGISHCSILITAYNKVLHYALDFRGCLFLFTGCGAASDHGKASSSIPWDPGGAMWWRLEGKPPFKEGGMLATFPYIVMGWTMGCRYWTWAYRMLRERPATYTRRLATSEGGLELDGFGLHSLGTPSSSASLFPFLSCSSPPVMAKFL